MDTPLRFRLSLLYANPLYYIASYDRMNPIKFLAVITESDTVQRALIAVLTAWTAGTRHSAEARRLLGASVRRPLQATRWILQTALHDARHPRLHACPGPPQAAPTRPHHGLLAPALHAVVQHSPRRGTPEIRRQRSSQDRA